jgi:hypothetical protein
VSARAAQAVLLAAALALMAICHFQAHSGYALRLDTAHTLYTPAPRPLPQTAPPPVAERVWLIILDGLRADLPFSTHAMPTLERLAEKGVRRRLIAGFPSYTWGGLTAFATGIEPFYSGVRLNTGHPPQHWDTLIASAARAGVASIIAAEWRRMGRVLDRERAGSLLRLAPSDVIGRAPAREILWMHFDEIDHAGHAHGARSAAYRAAMQKVDARFLPVVDAIDLSRDALVIVSDHGHLDRGGHGGAEPDARAGLFVAAGRGIRRGVHLHDARAADLCATVALLAGVPPPADNLGRPLVDVLDADDAERGRLLLPGYLQRADADGRRDGTTYATPFAETLRSGRASADVVDAVVAQLDGRRDVHAAFIDRNIAAQRRTRLVVAALLSLLLLAVWLIPAAWRPRPRDAVPTLVYAVVFAIGYILAGYRLSWTLPRGEPWFVIDTAALGIGAAALALAFGRIGRLGGDPDRIVRRASLIWFLSIVYVFAAAISGLDPAWMAGPRASFALPLGASAVFYLALGFAVELAWALVRKHA